MKAKSANNNLVGRTVLIDWPCRWRGASPQFQAQLKAEAAAKEFYFGQTGEIVGYNPADFDHAVMICLDSNKDIAYVHTGAITITSDAPPSSDKEIVDLLKQIVGIMGVSH